MFLDVERDSILLRDVQSQVRVGPPFTMKPDVFLEDPLGLEI